MVRVPAYSPYAVAEHTLALMLALNRKLHRAYNRVREGNFALDGLRGFDMHGKTAGIIGTGKIGTVVAEILSGFHCSILAFDPIPNEPCRSLGVNYVRLEELLAQSDIISLHCPLTPENKHMINAAAIATMKTDVMLINTSRGALLDTIAVIEALKSGKIGYLGLDVYEEEEEIFFEDRSGLILSDDVFARLLTFPNVIVIGHQAFFTREDIVAENQPRTILKKDFFFLFINIETEITDLAALERFDHGDCVEQRAATGDDQRVFLFSLLRSQLHRTCAYSPV